MTTAKIASNAGRTRSKANRPSERRTPRVMGWRLRQRLLQAGELLEALRHGHAAPDDVVNDRERLGVVFGVPRLLVGPDDLPLRGLQTEKLEVDPAVVRLDDFRVLVHLRVRVVETGDQAPLPLDVPVTVEVSAEEPRQ